MPFQRASGPSSTTMFLITSIVDGGALGPPLAMGAPSEPAFLPLAEAWMMTLARMKGKVRAVAMIFAMAPSQKAWAIDRDFAFRLRRKTSLSWSKSVFSIAGLIARKKLATLPRKKDPMPSSRAMLTRRDRVPLDWLQPVLSVCRVERTSSGLAA